MEYHVFESGSKGNCTLISSNGRYLLIDIGISAKKLRTKLKEVNVDINDIKITTPIIFKNTFRLF